MPGAAQPKQRAGTDKACTPPTITFTAHGKRKT
jgi:hypothetical protein